MSYKIDKSASNADTAFNETKGLIDQLQESFEGDPWFGRSIISLLSEVDESLAFEKPSGQHSILELLWHMIIWREFTISRLKPSNKPMKFFEENDWQKLDHSDKKLWKQGLQKLNQTQQELSDVLQGLNESMLAKQVEDRDYNFRKLLNGIIQHDIYHLGQIAYISKMLKNK